MRYRFALKTLHFLAVRIERVGNAENGEEEEEEEEEEEDEEEEDDE